MYQLPKVKDGQTRIESGFISEVATTTAAAAGTGNEYTLPWRRRSRHWRRSKLLLRGRNIVLMENMEQPEMLQSPHMGRSRYRHWCSHKAAGTGRRRRPAGDKKKVKQKTHSRHQRLYGVSTGPQRIWAWDTFTVQPVDPERLRALWASPHTSLLYRHSPFALKNFPRSLSYRVSHSIRNDAEIIQSASGLKWRETSFVIAYGVNGSWGDATTGRPCKV
jgi:hypothetical protein